MKWRGNHKENATSSGYRSHVTKFTRLALDFQEHFDGSQMSAVSVLANFGLDWPEHLECLTLVTVQVLIPPFACFKRKAVRVACAVRHACAWNGGTDDGRWRKISAVERLRDEDLKYGSCDLFARNAEWYLVGCRPNDDSSCNCCMWLTCNL